VSVLAPAVVAGWPILCGAIAAAGSLGYRALKCDSAVSCADQSQTQNWVDIPIEDSQVVADSMARESEFVIRNDDVVATFRRSADGRCTVHVAGDNKTESELAAVGRDLVGRVTQQYAYNKVISELKAQGFSVTNEEITNDQTIRIRVTKFV
jgi:hypothetical protein